MKRLSVFLFLVIALNVALAKSIRQKRQSNDDQDDDALDNKYGWDLGSWSLPPRPSADGDRWTWSSQGNGRPNSGRGPRPRPNQNLNELPNNGNQRPRPVPTARPTTTSTTRAPNGSTTTTQSPAMRECIRNCPVTSEYNPVCGTDLVQYTNPGRLQCAQYCGVNVTLLRASRCPTLSTTTAAPAPTRSS